MMSRSLQGPAQSTTVRDIFRKARGRNLDQEARQNMAAGFFGNFPRNVDLQEALNMIARATEHFEAIPPLIRARFGNQPVNLIKFVQDEANYEEAVELGLISIEAQERREEAKRAALAAKRAAAQQQQANDYESQGNPEDPEPASQAPKGKKSTRIS